MPSYPRKKSKIFKSEDMVPSADDSIPMASLMFFFEWVVPVNTCISGLPFYTLFWRVLVCGLILDFLFENAWMFPWKILSLWPLLCSSLCWKSQMTAFQGSLPFFNPSWRALVCGLILDLLEDAGIILQKTIVYSLDSWPLRWISSVLCSLVILLTQFPPLTKECMIGHVSHCSSEDLEFQELKIRGHYSCRWTSRSIVPSIYSFYHG
jgi:hypothetical protein